MAGIFLKFLILILIIIQISGDTDVDWRTIPHYKGISKTVTFYTVWSKLYNGIDRANVVIEKIPQMELYANGTRKSKKSIEQNDWRS